MIVLALTEVKTSFTILAGILESHIILDAQFIAEELAEEEF
jgi:hypothetical protein